MKNAPATVGRGLGLVHIQSILLCEKHGGVVVVIDDIEFGGDEVV